MEERTNKDLGEKMGKHGVLRFEASLEKDGNYYSVRIPAELLVNSGIGAFKPVKIKIWSAKNSPVQFPGLEALGGSKNEDNIIQKNYTNIDRPKHHEQITIPQSAQVLTQIRSTHRRIQNKIGSSKKLIAAGEYAVTTTPENYQILGLGPCLGLVLYDPIHAVYGFAHVLAPDDRYKFSTKDEQTHPAIYLKTAIPLLIREMIDKGAKRSSIDAKLVGAARVVEDASELEKENLHFARLLLKREKIAIACEDVGGSLGRSILEIRKDGLLKIRTGQKKYTI